MEDVVFGRADRIGGEEVSRIVSPRAVPVRRGEGRLERLPGLARPNDVLSFCERGGGRVGRRDLLASGPIEPTAWWGFLLSVARHRSLLAEDSPSMAFFAPVAMLSHSTSSRCSAGHLRTDFFEEGPGSAKPRCGSIVIVVCEIEVGL